MSTNANWTRPWELPEFEHEYEYIVLLNGKAVTVDRETYLKYLDLAFNPPIKKIKGEDIIITIKSKNKKAVDMLAHTIFYDYPYQVQAPAVIQDGEYYVATIVVAPEEEIDLSPVDVWPMKPRRVKKRKRANQKDSTQNL
jgi:hypothetical protein